MGRSVDLITVQTLPDPPHRNVVRVRPGRRLAVEANREVDHSLTPWVHFLTPIAMARGAALRLEGPADATALPASRAAQRVLAEWWPDFAEVEVEADWTEPTRPADGVGLFFSGGVDSFYSALQHADEVTHLIFVSGFDIGLHKDDLTRRTLEVIREVAADMGKELLEARTNIRKLSNQYCDWGKQYHGAALAGIAHMFSPVIGKAIIPASFADDHAWGSHHRLDPLWSSRVTIVHDETVRRIDKLARIAESDLALKHLRVCYSASNAEYNCGRCEKCLRTMTSLYTFGALDRARTLPHTIDPARVRKLYLKGSGRIFAEENLARLREMPDQDLKLERALATALRRSPGRGKRRRAKKKLRLFWQDARLLPGRAARAARRRVPATVKARLRALAGRGRPQG